MNVQSIPAQLEYSVIVPVKDEEGNLERLLDEIHSSMASLGETWEIVCIDDGSKDGSYLKLKELQKIHPQLRIVKMAFNVGQSAALKAGFELARGQWILTLDADLQNDPRDIVKLCAFKSKADLVCGWRKDRQDTFQKRFISKLANRIRSQLCVDGVHDTGCSLKLMRKEAVQKIFWFRGAHRFIPALFLLEGYRLTEVAVNHRARYTGTSHYHLFNRGLAPIVDMLAFIWLRRRKINYRVERIDEPID